MGAAAAKLKMMTATTCWRKWWTLVLAAVVGLTAVLGAAGSAAPARGSASSTYVGNVTGDLRAFGYRGPRKLVRDADGYWYAVWTGYVGGQYRGVHEQVEQHRRHRLEHPRACCAAAAGSP